MAHYRINDAVWYETASFLVFLVLSYDFNLYKNKTSLNRFKFHQIPKTRFDLKLQQIIIFCRKWTQTIGCNIRTLNPISKCCNFSKNAKFGKIMKSTSYWIWRTLVLNCTLWLFGYSRVHQCVSNMMTHILTRNSPKIKSNPSVLGRFVSVSTQ